MLSDLAGMRTERGHVTDLWMAAAMNELDKVQLLAERPKRGEKRRRANDGTSSAPGAEAVATAWPENL